MPETVVVFAALGANPAPLIQLVWALDRKQHLLTAHITTVVDARGHKYLSSEVLGRGGAWDRLRGALGPDTIDRKSIQIVPVITDSGDLLPSDEAPEDATRYNEGAWRAAREAIALAGDRPVIFALVAGRRRTMHVAATVLFQLLARAQDRLVDVRVSERWAETAGAFYFPDQDESNRRRLSQAGSLRDPKSVDIILVDVQVPRLRSLLRERDLMTYAAALRAGQCAVDASSAIALVFDLTRGTVQLGEEDLPLSKVQFIWYSTLAQHRCADRDGEGWLAVRDVMPLWRMARACSTFAWSEAVHAGILEHLMSTGNGPKTLKSLDEETLRKLRADTVRRIRLFCKGRPREVASSIVPARRKVSTGHMQRIALDPSRIEILGA